MLVKHTPTLFHCGIHALHVSNTFTPAAKQHTQKCAHIVIPPLQPLFKTQSKLLMNLLLSLVGRVVLSSGSTNGRGAFSELCRFCCTGACNSGKMHVDTGMWCADMLDILLDLSVA